MAERQQGLRLFISFSQEAWLRLANLSESLSLLISSSLIRGGVLRKTLTCVPSDLGWI